MKNIKGKIIKLLVDFFEEDYMRIEHAIDVLKYSEHLMEEEKNCDEDVLIACALLHDVGIKPSEKELGYNNGKTQEQYGPPIVKELLGKISYPFEKIEKVAQIVGNHHSPSKHDYIELEILKQADKIVNFKERSKNV